MKAMLIVAASLVAMLVGSSTASAWDPEWEDPSPEPEPTAAWSSPGEPVDPPPGIYLVTDSYVADVVTSSGPVTVYATETVHQTTGSYARVLESVATGGSSDFDGAAFNGRAAMTDGRSVAGTYYENFVRTEGGFIPVSIVFFQDDQEVARATRATARPPVSVETPAVSPPVISAPAMPATAAPAMPAVGQVDPSVDRSPLPQRGTPGPALIPTRPAPEPLADRAVEVLRARRIAISFSDPGMTGWRFTGGEGIVLGASSGGPAQAFVARWDRLPPSGGVWVARFAIDLGDGTTRDLTLRVTVRAPGLVE